MLGFCLNSPKGIASLTDICSFISSCASEYQIRVIQLTGSSVAEIARKGTRIELIASEDDASL